MMSFQTTRKQRERRIKKSHNYKYYSEDNRTDGIGTWLLSSENVI